jgi:hypothetical protein
MDNDRGDEEMGAMEDDMIAFRRRGSDDDPCDATDEDTELRSTRLARGNVKQH